MAFAVAGENKYQVGVEGIGPYSQREGMGCRLAFEGVHWGEHKAVGVGDSWGLRESIAIVDLALVVLVVSTAGSCRGESICLRLRVRCYGLNTVWGDARDRLVSRADCCSHYFGDGPEGAPVMRDPSQCRKMYHPRSVRRASLGLVSVIGDDLVRPHHFRLGL